MRDPILGAILAQDEMIDRKAEQISKERGIKDPVEARIEAIAYARSGNGIIDLLARKRDEIIDARIRAKEEAAHNFLVSQGWDGVDTEKAKEIADKFICEEHPDGTITFREKTEEDRIIQGERMYKWLIIWNDGSTQEIQADDLDDIYRNIDDTNLRALIRLEKI